LELEFPTKKLNPQINLPFHFLIQKYFFHDDPTWNNTTEYLLVVQNQIEIDPCLIHTINMHMPSINSQNSSQQVKVYLA